MFNHAVLERARYVYLGCVVGSIALDQKHTVYTITSVPLIVHVYL